jgi:hypothetical protein
MRNPLPVLAAALLAAAGAFAADLPTWQTTDEPAWREVEFTDASGGFHSLHCRWSECGTKIKTGQAALYLLERVGSEPYTTYTPYHAQYAETYFDKSIEWIKEKTTTVPAQSSKTTYKSQLSRFVLDLSSNPNKAVIKGTDVAISIDPQHPAFDVINPIYRVLPPIAAANDVPAAPAKPTPKPAPDKPAPGKPAPGTTTHAKPKPKPSVHPGAPAAAFPLYTIETKWLTPKELSDYTLATGPTAKPDAIVAASKTARDAVLNNLRPEKSAGYAKLLAEGTSVQIEPYLWAIPFYKDLEVHLSKDERDQLLTIVKSTTPGGAHSDFASPNAQLEYDNAMKTLFDAGTTSVSVKAHVQAHQVTLKFRAMLPQKPGAGPNDPPVQLSAADLAKLPKADQDAYNTEWAAAKTDDDKRAVNKKYSDKIAALNPAAPGTGDDAPIDPKSIKSLKDLQNGHSAARQLEYCKLLSSDAGPDCGPILSNADAATSKCNALTGADQTATIKLRNDCMAKINACTPPAAGAKPLTVPSAGLPDDLRQYCATMIANATTPVNPIGTGGGPDKPPAIDNNPCGAGGKGKPAAKPGDKPVDPSTVAGKDEDPCPKKDGDKPDANFYSNLGNGVGIGIFGLLVASFFGGPLLMLAVGVAAGVGAYYASKAIQAPPPKDDKDKKKGS